MNDAIIVCDSSLSVNAQDHIICSSGFYVKHIIDLESGDIGISCLEPYIKNKILSCAQNLSDNVFDSSSINNQYYLSGVEYISLGQKVKLKSFDYEIFSSDNRFKMDMLTVADYDDITLYVVLVLLTAWGVKKMLGMF